MSFFASQRPNERFVRLESMGMYYFIHQLERANTKQFRRCDVVELGDYALCLKAKVLDPSLMQSSMADEIFVQTRVMLEGGENLEVRGRVVWTEEIGDSESKEFLVGLEFTEADEGERDAFFAKAIEAGELVDPSAS